jgi:hypothetical protein
MRIKPIEKPKLILGGVVVVFLIVVGVANANTNNDPATDITVPATVVDISTTAGPTCDSDAYEGPDGLCTSDALPDTTVPVDTDTFDAPPADDNTGSDGSDVHVHVCVGHHIRICS